MPLDQPVSTADATLAGFLQSIELAIVGVYTAIMPVLREASRDVVEKFQAHHSAYAEALAPIAGASAVRAPNPVLSLVLAARTQAATDEVAALTVLFGLENQVAATYGYASTVATSSEFARTIATIVPPTAGRCAVLGSLAGLSTPLLFPNGPVESATVADGTDGRLGFDPAAFPTS
jgi:hypothetical protein